MGPMSSEMKAMKIKSAMKLKKAMKTMKIRRAMKLKKSTEKRRKIRILRPLANPETLQNLPMCNFEGKKMRMATDTFSK